MDGKKLLKNILWKSSFLGSFLFFTAVQAASIKVNDRFWTRDIGLRPGEVKSLNSEVRERGGPNNKLYWAIWFDNVALTKRLLEKGADPNRVIPPSRVPGNRRPRKNEGKTPLEHAASSGNPRIVKLLLKHGADINRKRIGEYDKETTPLREAVEMGKVNVVKLLLERGANPHWKDLQNRTLLHTAVSIFREARDSMLIVELLLDQGIDPNSKSDSGRVPLIGLMHQILSETSIYHQRIWEMNEASSRSQIRGRRESLERISRDIDRCFQILELFVNRGADINACDNNGNTLLHWAIPSIWHTNPNLELFKKLIEFGIDANRANDDGETPLDLLLRRKEELCHNDKKLQNEYDEAIAFLREHGATEGQPRDEMENQSNEEHEAESKAEDGEN
jgi:ankyrin repeat protein